MKLFRRGRESEKYVDPPVEHKNCGICNKVDHKSNMICEQALVEVAGDWGLWLYSGKYVHLSCGLKKHHLKPCPCGKGFISVRKK